MALAKLCRKITAGAPAWALGLALGIGSAMGDTACPDGAKPCSRKMNIPYFVYRDVNRNGRYDLADRPYAGLAVGLERPHGGREVRVSNVSGFVNFAMSLNNDRHEIQAPGLYRLKAEPAPGWTVTSDNGTQDLRVKALAGSPAGLVVEGALTTIGVAPALTVSGRLSATTNSDVASHVAVASSDGRRTRQAQLSPEGDYEIPVENGSWRLRLNGPSVPFPAREVEVSGYPVVISEFRTDAQSRPRTGNKTTITFDDLTHSGTLYKVPNGYAALRWHNWIATHQKFYGGPGYLNGTVSGEYLAYNGSGHPATFSAATPFDFLGVYVGVAWNEAESGFVEIQGWREDELIYSDRIRASVSGPVRFQADYTDVTRVVFRTEHYWQVVIDDLAISVTGSDP